MPWTAQVSESENYVSGGLVTAPWGEQGSENEAYTKNKRDCRVYSNSGEQVLALGGFPVLALSIEPLWITQAGESVIWEG